MGKNLKKNTYRCFWIVVLKKTLESPLDCKIKKKSNLNIHWKDWCWSRSCISLATWCKELTHWKRPWCWKRLKAGGKGDDRGWNCWMASPAWWTCIWASSGNWWWTEKPGVLQSMGCKESDMTERLNWLVRYFVEYFNWYLYNICLMINLELWVLWKKTTDIKFSSYSAVSEIS